MTTTARTYGADFSYGEQAEGILGYIGGGDYNGDESNALLSALMDELESEVDSRLPEGWSWSPHTSEFLCPVDTDAGVEHEEMSELFTAAWEAVEGRYDEIESATLPVLPIEATIETLPDEPIERVRATERLIRQARNAQERFAQERRAAIFAATRLMSYEDLAGELGVSTAAINKAVSEHRRSR